MIPAARDSDKYFSMATLSEANMEKRCTQGAREKIDGTVMWGGKRGALRLTEDHLQVIR